MSSKDSVSTADVILAVVMGIVVFVFLSDPTRQLGLSLLWNVDPKYIPYLGALIGALIGYFLLSLIALAIILLAGFAAYLWFDANYVPGTNYEVTVTNKSLKNLSLKVVYPVKCSRFKPSKNQDLIFTLNPGESKTAFDGCKASAFGFSVNGVGGQDFKPQSGSCFILTSNLSLVFDEQGWTDDSVRKALFGEGQTGFRPKPFQGAIREC